MAMQPLTVSIPHRLGKDEAVRRIQNGVGTLREKFSDKISVLEETWTDEHMDFRVAAMGQQASGRIQVAEDAVHLALELPYLLHLAASTIKDLVQKQGTLLLEKK